MKSLPVVERCYQLLVQLVQAVGQFPRQPRYLLGERLETCCLDLLDCLLEAQSQPQTRAEALARASLLLDRMMLLLRLCHDLRLLGVRRYEHLARGALDVAKQVGGWRKAGQVS